MPIAANSGVLENVASDCFGTSVVRRFGASTYVDARTRQWIVLGRAQCFASYRRGIALSVSNSSSDRHWELNQVPAMGDPTHII